MRRLRHIVLTVAILFWAPPTFAAKAAKAKPPPAVPGARTYLRVTVGDGYDRPVYLHVFADHYQSPWYKHYAIARSGAVPATGAKKSDLLKSGERTPWCDITPMLYGQTGARLDLSMRHGYTDRA